MTTKINKRLLIIAAIVVVAISSCNNKPKPVIINPDLLKYDWGSEYYFLKVENDSLLWQTLHRELSDDPIDWVASYKINYDTLFIFDRYNPNSLKQTVFKYKIVEVDSLKLILKEIPTRFMDTLVFNKITRTKKNDLKFERIDFYGSGGIGPALSLSIESDSIMYQYSYANTRHRGVSKYKLSPFEFSRIQTKLNYIDWDNVVMESPWPSSGYYMLFIKTANDSIELDGRSSNNEDLNDFLAYLKHLERFLNLTSIENQEVYFRYGRWGELN